MATRTSLLKSVVTPLGGRIALGSNDGSLMSSDQAEILESVKSASPTAAASALSITSGLIRTLAGQGSNSLFMHAMLSTPGVDEKSLGVARGSMLLAADLIDNIGDAIARNLSALDIVASLLSIITGEDEKPSEFWKGLDSLESVNDDALEISQDSILAIQSLLAAVSEGVKNGENGMTLSSRILQVIFASYPEIVEDARKL